MGVKPLVAILLLCALALSGCSGKGGGDDADSGDSVSSTTVTAQPNRAPTALLNVSATNGTSPLNVTFTIGGADLDNDTLSWSLSFGDGNQANGTSLPANATYVYNATENLTVQAILTVTDGTLNATANVTIQVLPAVAGAGTVFEGEVTLPCDTPGLCYVVGANGCIGWNAQEQGLDCIWFELAPELVGQPFVTESGGDVDLDFRSDCQVTGSSIAIFGAEGQEEGDVPDGSGCVVLSDFVAAGLLRIVIG